MKTITITIQVPDGVTVDGVTTVTAQNAPQAAAAPASASVCPKHGANHVKPSKFGGVYCTAADETEAKGYCRWSAK